MVKKTNKKQCSFCKKTYDASLKYFHKGEEYKDGLRSNCINCTRKRGRKYYEKHKKRLNYVSKKWRKENPLKYKASLRKWVEKNKDKIKEKTKEYYKKNREEISQKGRDYYKKHRKKLLIKNNKYYKNKRNKIRRTLNTLMRQDLGKHKSVKFYKSWEDFVDYNLDDIMKHLEDRFIDGMSWDNYGDYWRINRIEKRKDLDIQGVEDENFKKLWSLRNIEPIIIE